jgi:site-specific recombinase XerD
MKDTVRIAPFLTAFFRDFLISERNLSQNTVASYRDALKLFLIFMRMETGRACTEILMQDIDAAVVRRFLVSLEEDRGNSIRSRNHRLVVLRAFFEYVAGREPALAGICSTITSIPHKKGPCASIDYFEKEEIEAIFDEIDRSSAQGQRDFMLLLFLYNSGARVQEAADLCISWLTLTKPYRVSILGKGRKWRICPLWTATGEALRDLLAQRVARASEEHVFLNRFGEPFSRHGILNIVKRYAGQAAVKMPSLSQKRLSPHIIRHSTAMHLLQSGNEQNAIRSWLGHASIETTNQYTQIDLEMKTRAMERCEASFLKVGDGPRLPTWKADPDILAWLKSL